MRRRHFIPIAAASAASVLVIRGAHAGPTTVPGYNIYAFPATGGTTPLMGQSISSNGVYAAGVVQTNSVSANAVLYNLPSGTTTLESQDAIKYYDGSSEPYGIANAVNNQGIIVGSSGTSVNGTGAASVWNNGVGANLPLPRTFSGGQVYGENDLNGNLVNAVGSVGGNGGLNTAAIFHYYLPGSGTTSYASTLNSSPTTNGGKLQAAFAINDSNQIVGTANDPNNAALTVPFFLNFGSATASIIPNSSSAFNSGIPFAISNSGLVTGSELFNSGGGEPFVYNSSSNVTTSVPLVPGTSGGTGRGINNIGEVVGTDSGLYAVPFLYDGTNSYDLQTLLVNNTAGQWQLDDNTSSGAWAISDSGTIVGRGMYNGSLTAYVMVPTGTSISAPANLTFNNAGGSGDGRTWDTTSLNWNNGSGVTTFSSIDKDVVTFNDANNGHYNVSIPSAVYPGQVNFNASGNYVFNGAGGIAGSCTIYKFGTGTVTLNTVNTYTGPTNVYQGTVILAVPNALPSVTALDISGSSNNSASVIITSLGAPYAVTLKSLSAYGNGSLDLTNNALVLTSGYLSSINSMLKAGYAGGAWNGYSNSPTNYPPGITYSGIISSMAGAGHPLMAIGGIVNDNGSGTPLYGVGGAIASSFDGAVPVDGNILVKYTYYGDANLSGSVDSLDYTLLDNGYLSQSSTKPLTGWYNGDFNYDGVINGSDYTLIDNAFNAQGAAVSSQIASVTTEISPATTSVPEPAGLMAGAAALGLLSRRRRRIRGNF